MWEAEVEVGRVVAGALVEVGRAMVAAAMGLGGAEGLQAVAATEDAAMVVEAAAAVVWVAEVAAARAMEAVMEGRGVAVVAALDQAFL